MNDKTIKLILYVSGIVTMMPGLQFLAPTLFLEASGMQVGDATGLFFVRHWGLLVFCLGALLVYAAWRADIRRPVMFAAAGEKFGLVAVVLTSWGDPALKGLHLAAGFDAACVVLYMVYLLRKPVSVPAGGLID